MLLCAPCGETANRFHYSIRRTDRHPVNAKSRFYLLITYHVILSQFSQPFCIQRQMKQRTQSCATFHHFSVHFPDMRLLTHSFTHKGYQFIRRQSFIITHVINTARYVFYQQTFHNIAKIIYRSKRTLVLKIA